MKAGGMLVVLLLLLGPSSLQGQGDSNEEVSWAPKPMQPIPWIPPNKPLTKLIDLSAKHKGEENWREVVVDDEHLHAEYVFASPGARVSRRFHPDTREWWVVMQGRIRFEIEG